MKKPRLRRADILAALLQSAYLPKELPPVVTSRHFAAHAKSIFKTLSKLQEDPKALKEATQFDRYNVPREAGTRRDLALVHPRAQLNLSLILTERHQDIRSLIADMQISAYDITPDLKNFRAFKGITFGGLDRKRSDVARRKPWILVADISRFFYTIYTHSIPWAVLGKEKVKDSLFGPKPKKTKKKHWTDRLDAALQGCQSRETFGIPVGPDTSRIVAEILLSGIHNDNDLSAFLDGAPGYRLVDDFFVGFDNERDCQQALSALRNALSQFNLQLNDEKTGLKKASEIFMDRWRFELLSAAIDRSGDAVEGRGIRKATELALYHAASLGNAHPIKWICQKLIRFRCRPANFSLLLTTLLRLGRDFPSTIDLVAVFIINNKVKCSQPLLRTRIEEWIKAIFASHSRNSHDFEVTWALVICGALNIDVSISYFGDYANSICSVAFAILGLLSTKGLLLEPLSRFGWRQEVKKFGINGHHWLMYYESVLRQWTRDKQMIAAVKADPLLGDLLKAGVTFLDDTIFGDVVVDLDRRRMRRRPPMPAIATITSFGTASI